jgi:hypothetical protein
VRDLFTAIKNQEAPISLASFEFSGERSPEAKPPRFDQLILKYKGKRPQLNRRNQEQPLRFNEQIDSKGRFKRFDFKEPF